MQIARPQPSQNQSRSSIRISAFVHCRSLISPCPFAASPGGTSQSPFPRYCRSAASTLGDTQRRTEFPSTRITEQAVEPEQGCPAMPEPDPQRYRVRQTVPTSKRYVCPLPNSSRSFRAVRGGSFPTLQSQLLAVQSGLLLPVRVTRRKWCI
jgi:hypothetical protein